MDKKIRQSAEGYEPAYDDKNWDKMHLLLDKHLPEKKKRRRLIIFWLLPLALIGTGIFYFSQKQTKKNITRQATEKLLPQEKNEPAIKENDQATKQPAESTVKGNPALKQESASTLEKDSTGVQPKPEEIKSAQDNKTALQKQLNSKKTGDNISRKNKKKVLPSEPIIKKAKPTNKLIKEKTGDKFKKNDPVIADADENAEKKKTIAKDGEKINDTNITSAPTADTTAISKAETVKENKPVDSLKVKDTVAAITKMTKTKGSPLNKLSLLFSGGPDISSVGFDNPGKWEFQYGIGFSYAISKKLSIRTGFYTARKIYTADSNDYHSSYVPPKLQKVNANCIVYEIPLNLIYSFPATKKHNWFVASGLSSYLMKKETYDYYYTNAWGQTQIYTKTYKNENTHIFSVINLSGGYQYHFTDRISFLAEPYFRIPVSGVGHGKVKLNSAGILFTAGFKPFGKK